MNSTDALSASPCCDGWCRIVCFRQRLRAPVGGERCAGMSGLMAVLGAVAARAQKLQRSRGATTGASCSSAQSKSSADGADAGCPMDVRVMNESGTTAKNTGWTRSYSILWRTFAKSLCSCGSHEGFISRPERITIPPYARPSGHRPWQCQYSLSDTTFSQMRAVPSGKQPVKPQFLAAFMVLWSAYWVQHRRRAG